MKKKKVEKHREHLSLEKENRTRPTPRRNVKKNERERERKVIHMREKLENIILFKIIQSCYSVEWHCSKIVKGAYVSK